MKKYIRRTTLLNFVKFSIFTLLVLVSFVSIYILTKSNEIKNIGIAIVLMLIFIEIIGIFSSLHRYSYKADSIVLEYLGVKYKKIECKEIEKIIISRGSYNNSFGYLMYTSIPLNLKKEKRKIPYPYITLQFQKSKNIELIDGMDSREIHFNDVEGTYCLGICWIDSLLELLDHTDAKIFVLKDIYTILEKEFKDIAELIKNDNRFCVIDNEAKYRKPSPAE